MKTKPLTNQIEKEPQATSIKKPLLAIKELSAGYGKSLVLKKVSLEVGEGECVALIGPNGAGKSTVLRSIFAITTLHEGSILFQNQDVTRLNVTELVRRHIIYVNQGKVVFPNLTVAENLEMPGSLLFKGEELQGKIDYALSLFPILKEKYTERAFSLSGGQRQQLVLARALVQDPRLLLLDEPTLGLSPKLQQELFQKIELLNQSGVAILMVEQNARSAIQSAHRTYLLENGEVALTGGRDILKHPMIKKVYLGG